MGEHAILPSGCETMEGAADRDTLLPSTDVIGQYLRQIGTRLLLLESGGKRTLLTHAGHTDILLPAGPGTRKAWVPAVFMENLGHPQFKARYGLRYAYVVGAMARGISSVEMVAAAADAGMMGFFGAAGLSLQRIESAILDLRQRLGSHSFGMNLIHTRHSPEYEAAVVALYLQHQVRTISASAYVNPSLSLVRYRVSGLRREAGGRIVCPNRVIAKVSHPSVARKFFSPPPADLLARLLDQKAITAEEAELARQIPLAQDLTFEADSGGHTDNRPAISLFPVIRQLGHQLSARHGYSSPPCVGLAGGMARPESVAAAFAMGADYVLAGSIHQACVEAGTAQSVRNLLCEAGPADVAMAPSADMFELGAKVQVLKRGTLFAARAAKLQDLYLRYDSLDDLPSRQRDMLERDIFQNDLASQWAAVRDYFSTRDPGQVVAAEKNPKRKMALLFRAYLGQASLWAVRGEAQRARDYQIWCGPSMGAFNSWVKESFLAVPENRETPAVALNLLYGACVLTRAGYITGQGIALEPGATRITPLPVEQILEANRQQQERPGKTISLAAVLPLPLDKRLP